MTNETVSDEFGDLHHILHHVAQLQLGDIVRLGEGPYSDAQVIALGVSTVTLRRPYLDRTSGKLDAEEWQLDKRDTRPLSVIRFGKLL